MSNSIIISISVAGGQLEVKTGNKLHHRHIRPDHPSDLALRWPGPGQYRSPGRSLGIYVRELYPGGQQVKVGTTLKAPTEEMGTVRPAEEGGLSLQLTILLLDQRLQPLIREKIMDVLCRRPGLRYETGLISR